MEHIPLLSLCSSLDSEHKISNLCEQVRFLPGVPLKGFNMISIIKNLLKLKYLRDPCKKCLVKAMCNRDSCSKLDSHYDIYNFIGDRIVSIVLIIEITLFVIILGTIYLMRS